MHISGWIMFIFGCLILYGGLTICICIAKKGRGENGDSR